MGTRSQMSNGHTLSHGVYETSSLDENLTNVTALSWPDYAVHPRYAGAAGYRELRAELAADLADLSIEALAGLSWELAALLR